MLTSQQFRERDLEDIYLHGAPRRNSGIPLSQQATCFRRLNALDSAVAPEDLDLPGFGFNNAGGHYSMSVGGRNRIRYTWPKDQPEEIDYA